MESFQLHHAFIEEVMSPKIARLLGLGAYGACAAFIALFAYVAYLSSPSPTGGIMMSSSVVAYISLALVVVALIALHVAFGHQLMHVAKNEARSV
jgi:TRAP-type C4-dicarboxylate transport system permease small subunit